MVKLKPTCPYVYVRVDTGQVPYCTQMIENRRSFEFPRDPEIEHVRLEASITISHLVLTTIDETVVCRLLVNTSFKLCILHILVR